jgi:hypothetical protein
MSRQSDLEQQLAETMSQEITKEIDNEILKEVGWQIMLESNPDWHLVQLRWEKGKDSTFFWNEACAWAVEQFGLPGEKYMTHPTESHMDFLFKNQEDAVLMTLKWV